MAQKKPWDRLDWVQKRLEALRIEHEELRKEEVELKKICLSMIREQPDELLTRREIEVLSLLQSNPYWTNKDLSISLCISERTVKFHISSLLIKFGASSRSELCQKNYLTASERLKPRTESGRNE